MQMIPNYIHFIILPLKICGCWEWFKNPKHGYQIFINSIYLAMVMFVLISLQVSLIVYLYTEWVDIMSSLEKLSDGLPVLVSIAIVAYFAIKKKQLYKLVDFMNKNFRYHSARGLTNMTMWQSYRTAKRFAFVYSACTLFSVSMYLIVPVAIHLWTKKPLQGWMYMNVTKRPLLALLFLRQTLGQAIIGLAMGQLGVFFASNAIIICGQLDLLCCSLRNIRYTALLHHGVPHTVLAAAHSGIVADEHHNYIYNDAEMKESDFHYDRVCQVVPKKMNCDIYSAIYDEATMLALRDCARMSRYIKAYKQMFEEFVSPLLALRVVQVTLYLCTLLYAATKKFDMITVEYLAAVALDIFVYCFYGSKIILQIIEKKLTKELVTHLFNLYEGCQIKLFPIIKTSFSYYTLLVNVNEKKSIP